jgi:type IV secretory pathway VirB6-like protein
LDSKTALKNCLINDVYRYGNTQEREKYTCALIVAQYNRCTTETCQMKSNVEIEECEDICITKCLNTADSSGTIPWVTNTPSGTTGNSVSVIPGSLIYMTLFDKISLSDTKLMSNYTYSIDPHIFHGTKKNLIGLNQYTSASSTVLQSGFPPTPNDYVSTLILNLAIGANLPSKYDNRQVALSDTNNLYGILTKNLLVFKKYPDGKDIYSSIPIEGDVSTTSCNVSDNDIYISNPKKMSCSEKNSVDNYLNFNEDQKRATSIAYNFGTDVNINFHGGYIRNEINSKDLDNNNIISLTNSEVDANTVKVEGNSRLNIPSTQGSDNYLQVKVSDKSCANRYADIDIYQENVKVFAITNLQITDTFSTEEIPLYKNSSIEIKRPTCTSCSSIINDNCNKKLILNSKSYLDIEVPSSGFIQFKMMPINSTVPQNCKLYARLINPEGNKKLITKSLSFSSSPNYQLSGSSNPDSANLDLDFTSYGLFAFTNSNKSELSISNTCSSINSSLPASCQRGDGVNGGGGGNIGGLVSSTFNRLATSYVNTEFINIDSLSSSIDSLRGRGQDKSDGGNGVVIFESYSENTKSWIIQNQSEFESFENRSITITSDHKCLTQNNEIKTRCLKFTIIGGAGGPSSCSDGGKIGYNGDRFSGIIDFSHLSSDISSIVLKYRNGKGGASQCDQTTMIGTTADITSGVYLKGFYGTFNQIGHGGSASYIYYNQSTDANPRNVILAIAAGGNGGKTGETRPYDSYLFPPTNKLEIFNTNINYYSTSGVYISKFKPKVSITEDTGPAVSATPNLADFDNYHEYNFSPDAPPLDRDPLLPFLNVSTNDFSTEFFARKGQIIRIYPEKSFYNQFWNSGHGLKECGVGMVMKITPRPAVLCYSHSTTSTIPNPDCVPNFKSEIASDESSTVSPQNGCAIQTNCNDESALKCGPPLKDKKCFDIECNENGSDTSPRTCNTANPTPPLTNCSCQSGVYANNCFSVNNAITNDTCRLCRERRYNEATASPIITVTIPACYYFGDRPRVSVHKFFKYFDKRNLIQPSSFEINPIADYPTYKDGPILFGKFPGIKVKTTSNTFSTTEISVPADGKIFGLRILNSDFKNLTFSNPNPDPAQKENLLVFDFSKPANFSNGEYLDITLCKESSDTSIDCKTTQNSISSSNIVIDLVKYNPGQIPTAQSPQYIKFGYLNQAIKILDFPSSIQRCTHDESNIDNKNYICFANNLGDKTQSSRYRMSFKIRDTYDNNYTNNSGSYSIKLTVLNSSNNGLGLVKKVLDIIMPKITGSPDDPATPENEFNYPLSSGIYSSIINTTFYKNILQMTIILLITFYGLGYLIGINEMKHSEIVKILLKIGIVYVFTSPKLGWAWFETFFIKFFVDSVDMLTFLTAQIFENSQELASKLANNDFSNKGILFLSVDKVLDTLVTSAVQNKITALIFSSIWGWVYFLIMLHSILLYFYAIANSVLLYITCQIINNILLSLAPLFFIMIFFNITKEIFDNWLKALIGFSLQQIFLIMTLSFFNIMFLEFLKYAIGYRVCWQEILSFKIGGRKVSLAHFWSIAGTNNQSTMEDDDIDESFGNDENIPSLYSMLTLWIVVGIMKKFIELFTNLAVSLSGGIKASTIGGGVKEGGQQIFGVVAGAATKLYSMTGGRLIQNLDKAIFDSGKLAKEEKKAKQEQFKTDMANRGKLMMAGNKAVSNFKKENALALSTMSRSEQKEVLQKVREKAMDKYAAKYEIKNHKELLNRTGLNYQGTNLIGAVIQAGRQGVTSGGNLFNSGYDRTVKTTFTKDEAEKAVMSMRNKEDRDLFIKNIEDGKVNVSRGKFDSLKDSIFMFKDAVSGSSKKSSKDKDDSTKDKDSVSFKGDKDSEKEASKNRNIVKDNVMGFGRFMSKNVLGVKNAIESDNKNRAIEQLVAEGKIESLKGQKTGVVKNLVNWTRSDKEKKLIRDRVRDIKDFKKSYSDETKKKTSLTTLKDLKNTSIYVDDLNTKGAGAALARNTINRFSPNLSSDKKEDYQISQNTIKNAQNRAQEIKDSFKLSYTPEQQKLREIENPNRLEKSGIVMPKEKVDESLQSMRQEAQDKLYETVKKFDEIRESNPAIQFIKDINSQNIKDLKVRKAMMEKINEKISGNKTPEDKQLEELKKMVKPTMYEKVTDAISSGTPDLVKKGAKIAARTVTAPLKIVTVPIKFITPKFIKDKVNRVIDNNFDKLTKVKNLEEKFLRQDQNYSYAKDDYKIAKSKVDIIDSAIKLNNKK